MSKNIHSSPFDEGTLTKLKIFEKYLTEWLPVFLAPRKVRWKKVGIYDFFAGPGVDVEKNHGSPIIILETIKNAVYNGVSAMDCIIDKNLQVQIYLNEYNTEKFFQLEKNISPYKKELDYISIKVDNRDFQSALEIQWNNICDNDAANLLFLDQNGIK
ncbi:MAG: three-Cys-motif partner protein TcmP, partial [Bacteroidetes bacterium]